MARKTILPCQRHDADTNPEVVRVVLWPWDRRYWRPDISRDEARAQAERAAAMCREAGLQST